MARYHEYRASDEARSFINIDDLLRVFSSAEKAEGLPETFKLKDPDKIVKESKCDQCKNKPQCKSNEPEEKKLTPFARGEFGLSYDDSDIDEDDTYVCELCDALGYSNKYIPEICDTCKACAGCAEYERGDCSGCSYSLYRDGEYYHTKLPESELISEHDQELFRDLDKPLTSRLKRNDGVGGFRNR